MLVSPKKNRRNRNLAVALTGATATGAVIAGWFYPAGFLGLVLAPAIYWRIRRRCLRRLRIMTQPFPASWEQILQSHVAFFRALESREQERFRLLVKVFLAEVRITGIRTAVDDTVRVLVAASAVIPIFGFDDWEYRRLGEVLVYPGPFDELYHTTGAPNQNRLGMVGVEHLRGIMILSKPSLLAGFDISSGSVNVGIHEFTHMVEQEEADHGLPPEVPWQAVRQLVGYVAREISHPAADRSFIRDYAYTNDHEFFAVLAEYFFKSPALLQKKDPQLYAMLRKMFHQDTASLLRSPRPARYDPHAPCPCGSGKKFGDCCLLRSMETGAAQTSEADHAPR